MNLKRLITSNTLSTRTVWYLIGTIAVKCVAVISSPIFTRYMPPDTYGSVSIFLMWSSIISIIIGLYTHGSVAVAVARYSEEERNSYMSSALTLSTISGFAFIALAFIFRKTLSSLLQIDGVMIPILFVYSFTVFIVEFYSIKLVQEKKQYAYLLVSLLIMLGTSVLSIMLILKMNDKYTARILGMLIPYAVMAVVLYLLLMRKGKIYYHKDYWHFALSFSLPLIIHCISSVVLAQSDRLMLQLYRTDTEVGIFSISYTFGSVIEMMWNAFNFSWIPTYYEYLNVSEYTQIDKRAINYSKNFTIITLGYILVSPEFFRKLTATPYWEGVPIVTMVAVSGYLRFLASYPINYQFYMKKTAFVAWGTTGAAIVNVIINFYFIPHYGAMGAAISTVIAYIFLLVANTLVVNKHFKLPNKTWSVKGLVLVFFGSAVVYFLYLYWLPRWLFATVCGVVLIRRTLKARSLF